MFDNKFIFFGYVLDNKDPLFLGRLRVFPRHEIKSDLVPVDVKGNPIPESVWKWTAEDPFIFLPLIPYYVSQVPEIGEYVHLLYYNVKERTNNSKFYIQGPITRPQNNAFEINNNSESLLASGEYIKLSNTLRDTTGSTLPRVYGIYPEPGDNAILSRGTTDMVLKKDTVLVRSGKNITTQTANFNIPQKNPNWGFLQISTFDQERVLLEPLTLEESIQEPLQIKKVIEWSIDGSQYISGITSFNTVTGDTFYKGCIYLYSMIPNSVALSTTIDLDTPINQYLSTVDYSICFSGLNFNDSLNIINTFIQNVNDSKININGYPQYPPTNDDIILNQFPFYVKPNYSTLTKLNSTGATDFNLVSLFNQKIKLNQSESEYGNFLVWSRGVIGQQTTVRENTVERTEYKAKPVSFGSLVADNVYLISHKSQIPSKGDKVNLQESLYGITQLQYTEEILDRTDPMVRGEELMKLLNKIVDFLGSHVHNPNEAPIGIGTDGTELVEIRKILQDADSTILNQNIRLN